MNMEPLPQPISSTQAPPRGIEIAEATTRAVLDSEKSSSQNEATESKYSAISRVYSFAVVVPLYFHCMRIQPAVQAPPGGYFMRFIELSRRGIGPDLSVE